MKYGTDVFGFGDALRLALGGGRVARTDWQLGTDGGQAVVFPKGDPRSYPAGSYLFLPENAAREVYAAKDTGRPVFAGQGMCLMVHRPGETPVNQRWVLDSSELFAVDWCDVEADEEEIEVRAPTLHLDK